MSDEATAPAGEEVRPKIKTISAKSLTRKRIGNLDAPAVEVKGVKAGQRVKIKLANGIAYTGRITDILDGAAVFADGLTRSDDE
mgnify:CR=1 FL=1